jgi:hypothetical protein
VVSVSTLFLGWSTTRPGMMAGMYNEQLEDR